LFQQLAQRKVEVRLLYAAAPSAPFMKRFSASRLEESRYFTMRRCPRVHMKTVIVDHRIAYMGSANLTGAGMGYRDERFRNFETGILTTDGKMIDQLESFFDFIWRGEMCQDCGRRNICPKPIKEEN
jgi:phosphatidylserine/phosphatidylglycerophosphate/cardiolipin synthase-like enzyme